MISEEMLRNAAIEADHVLMDSISQLEEHHEFSPNFEHNMKRIIRRAKHPLLYGSLKKVACFVMVLLISGSVFLTVNVEARAAFVGWLRETYVMFLVYHYDGECFEDQLSK